MEISELQALFERTIKRSRELEVKYVLNGTASRLECDEMRHCTQRLGLIAREIWLALGKPDDPEFEVLQKPIPLNPLPEGMRSTRYDNIRWN